MTEINKIAQDIIQRLAGARLVGVEENNPPGSLTLVFENTEEERCIMTFTAYIKAVNFTANKLDAVPGWTLNLTSWRK